MPANSNMTNAALNAYEAAEIEVDNAYAAVCDERRFTGRVHPLTDAAWQNAVANLNRARRAVQRATIHDRRH
jgi:hypothetical protein